MAISTAWQGPCTADRMGALWFEEADKQVWHLMTRRKGERSSYHTAWGWTLSPLAGRM